MRADSTWGSGHWFQESESRQVKEGFAVEGGRPGKGEEKWLWGLAASVQDPVQSRGGANSVRPGWRKEPSGGKKGILVKEGGAAKLENG